jgi:hypothetical protein
MTKPTLLMGVDNNLEVTIQYDPKLDFILLTIEDNDHKYTIGFNIGEAQMLNMQLAETITDAIMTPAITPDLKH